MINENQKAIDLIEALASNEEAVSRPYQGYAAAFPILCDFWMSLSKEENRHAVWIRNLGTATGSGAIFIDKTRFNVTATESVKNYLDRELFRLDSRTIPLIEALSITS